MNCLMCGRRIWWLNHGDDGVHLICKWYEFAVHDDQGVGA